MLEARGKYYKNQSTTRDNDKVQSFDIKNKVNRTVLLSRTVMFIELIDHKITKSRLNENNLEPLKLTKFVT